MNSVRFFLSCALLILILSTTAIAGTGPNSYLTTDPSPPPAGQEFAAVFHVTTNVGAAGFWAEYPTTLIDGNTLTFYFDEGCGWICQTNDQALMAFPFMMHALPEGAYVLRFVGAGNVVLGEFNITVGNGSGGGPPASLPVGGHWSLLFAVLIVLVAGTRLIGRQLKRESTV